MLAFLVSPFAFAQEEENLKGTLTIDKKAKIELGTVNRNFEKINNIQPVQIQTIYSYSAKEVDTNLQKIDTKVKVATSKGDAISKLYGDYLKVGIGNYTTPYLELFVNNKRSDKATYGLKLKHLSSQNGPVANSGTGENRAEAYGKYFTEKSVIGGNVAYQRNRYNYYGYDHIANPLAEEDTLKQILNQFTIGLNIGNKNKSDKFNYTTGLNYYNFFTYRNANESEVLWNINSDYKLDDTKKILLDAAVSYSNRADSSVVSRALVSFKPSILYTGIDNLTVVAGVNIAYANDTIKDYSKLHLYPKLQAAYKLIENKVIVFAGLEGDMQKNTLRTLSMENPYLGSDVALFHTNKTLDLYGGIKGGLKGGVTYSLKMSAANYKYLYFFNNDFTDTSRFTVLYDDGNSSVMNIGGELGYEVADNLRFGLSANYYKYNLSKVQKAWHRPDFCSSIFATYNLNKKLYFNVDFYYLGGLRGKNFVSGQELNLKGIADLNLKADYLLSKSFSLFIEANNIMSQKYQRYLYYNSKGFNILGGFTYSF